MGRRRTNTYVCVCRRWCLHGRWGVYVYVCVCMTDRQTGTYLVGGTGSSGGFPSHPHFYLTSFTPASSSTSTTCFSLVVFTVSRTTTFFWDSSAPSAMVVEKSLQREARITLHNCDQSEWRNMVGHIRHFVHTALLSHENTPPSFSIPIPIMIVPREDWLLCRYALERFVWREI